jgi:hypothetical protein
MSHVNYCKVQRVNERGRGVTKNRKRRGTKEMGYERDKT